MLLETARKRGLFGLYFDPESELTRTVGLLYYSISLYNRADNL